MHASLSENIIGELLRLKKIRSAVRKRSVTLNGHKTSVSIENEFWSGLKEIAVFNDITLFELASRIDNNRPEGNLSSAIRLYVLDHYVKRCGVELVTGVTKPTNL